MAGGWRDDYGNFGQDVTLRNGTTYVTAREWVGGYGRIFVFCASGNGKYARRP